MSTMYNPVITLETNPVYWNNTGLLLKEYFQVFHFQCKLVFYSRYTLPQQGVAYSEHI